MWKRILVPHDFAECAARATQLAVELAELHGASLTLLHVSPLPPNVPPNAMITPPGAQQPIRVDEYTTRGARAELDAIAQRLRERGVDVRTVALASSAGDIAREILTAASDLDAHAIVIGTHGRTGLPHIVLGSIAEKIVRLAPMPVVTVRTPLSVARPLREEEALEDELSG
jgi:nucleotide-binding universal stress UspA family protein